MKRERHPAGILDGPGPRVFSAAALLVCALLVAVPFLSLVSVRGQGDNRDLFAALRSVWGAGSTWSLLARTAIAALAVTVSAAVAGSLESLLYFRCRFRGRTILFFLSLFPLFVPPVLLAVGLVRLTDLAAGAGGSFGHVLHAAGAALRGYTGMVLVLFFSLRPLVTICAGGCLRTIPGELEESALLDGTPAAVGLRLSLRLAAPGILLGALLVFLRCMLDSAVPAAFGVRAYAFETFAMLSAFYDDAAAVAFATPLAVFGILIGIATVAAFQSLAARGLSLVRSPRLLRRGGFRLALIGGACLWGAPFWALGLWSLLHPVRIAVALGRNWGNVQDELARTAMDSSGTALLVLIGGFCLASVACYGSRALRDGVKGLFTLPLLVPPVLLGVAMVAFWNHPGWRGDVASTPALLVLGKTLLVVPIVAWSMVAVMSGLDRSLIESMAIDGARWRHILGHLFLPAVRAHLPLLGLVAFLLAAGEFEVSTLLAPPGWTPFAVRLFSLLHYGVDDVVAGLALVGFLLAVLIALAATWLARLRFLGGSGRGSDGN